MPKTNWDNFEFKDYINVSEIEIGELPKGVSISTMCATCKLGDPKTTKILGPNIVKYLSLCQDDVISIKSNSKVNSLIPEKKKRRSKKKPKEQKKKKGNHFYNQVTVVVRLTHGPTEDISKEPKINLKLFNNGSVQMSGCKSMNGINIALNKILHRLKEVKGVKNEDSITVIKFADSPEIPLGVYKFKVDMINSNYQVNLVINREKFYNLLLQKRIRSSYEPCIRACVIVKYVPPEENEAEKDISIFVFEKGNIIITGAKRKSHIMSSYNYINNIIMDHSHEIEKTDLDSIIMNSEFKDLMAS